MSCQICQTLVTFARRRNSTIFIYLPHGRESSRNNMPRANVEEYPRLNT